MATVNEVPRIARWLATVLRADATLASLATGGVWDTVIPDGKPYPAVVYSMVAPIDDTDGNRGTRIWSRSRWQVKAVAQGNSYAAVQTIADRIEAVLQAVTGGAADVAIDYCKRVGPVAYKERPVDKDAGSGYVHLGGEFELAARYAG